MYPTEKVEVTVLDCKHGWLNFTISALNAKVVVTASGAFNPFGDLLSFLESIAVGSRKCSFVIEMEGRDYEIEYEDHYVRGQLRIGHVKEDENQEIYLENILETYVDKAQLIQEFYTTFVNFGKSDDYRSSEYDELYFHEFVNDKYSISLFDDEIVRYLLEFDGKRLRYLVLGLLYEEADEDSKEDARSLFSNLAEKASLGREKYENTYSTLFSDFDNMDWNGKLEALQDFFFKNINQSAFPFNFNLNRFRSDIIEKYLLSLSEKDLLHRDSLHFEFDYYENDEERAALKISTFVNGIEILKGLYIDIFLLPETCRESGEYPLFLCGCGDEGCAGIFESPQVIVQEDTITWKIFEPEKHIFRFEKKAYIEAIEDLKRRLLDFKPLNEYKDVEYYSLSSIHDFL